MDAARARLEKYSKLRAKLYLFTYIDDMQGSVFDWTWAENNQLIRITAQNIEIIQSKISCAISWVHLTG